MTKINKSPSSAGTKGGPKGPPSKLKHLKRLLIEEFVLIHVNPRYPGVVLPASMVSDPNVTLKLSHLFYGNLEITASMVRAELMFGDTLVECLVPMKALWAMTSNTGATTIWDEDAPSPILAQLLRSVDVPLTPAQVSAAQPAEPAAAPAEPSPVQPTESVKAAPLRAVAFERDEPSLKNAELPPQEEPVTPPRPRAGVTPLLRRIK